MSQGNEVLWCFEVIGVSVWLRQASKRICVVKSVGVVQQ